MSQWPQQSFSMKHNDKENVDILFEDNHILALSKPPGLVTQPTDISSDSLEERAKHYIKEKYQKKGAVYLHAVHRIDKQVSGIVLFAKTEKALSRLSQYIREGKTTKYYFAIVEGIIKEKKGILESYLAHGKHRANIVDEQEGKKSSLLFNTLLTFENSSLLLIQLKTGRYHQIRALFEEASHPIVGDEKYNSRQKPLFDGIFLHHVGFQIPHPISKDPITLVDPPPNVWTLLGNISLTTLIDEVNRITFDE